MRYAALGAAMALLLIPPPASAQRLDPTLPRPLPPNSSVGIPGTGAPLPHLLPSWGSADDPPRPASPWAILASAALPGTGQLALGQRRGYAYLALEAVAWVAYSQHVGRARRSRGRYRTLASNVARAPFSASRPVGDFDYYERMEHYLASGVFDRSGGELLEPETDTTTFNGATWLLARRTYWSDPFTPPARGSVEWNRAEAFYLDRAIRPEFRWSWEGAAEAHDRFRRLIRESNDLYRAALSDLGLALGNHVLSTVDAYVTVRLRRGDLAERAGMGLGNGWMGDGGWRAPTHLIVQLPFQLPGGR